MYTACLDVSMMVSKSVHFQKDKFIFALEIYNSTVEHKNNDQYSLDISFFSLLLDGHYDGGHLWVKIVSKWQWFYWLMK